MLPVGLASSGTTLRDKMTGSAGLLLIWLCNELIGDRVYLHLVSFYKINMYVYNVGKRRVGLITNDVIITINITSILCGCYFSNLLF